MENVVYRFTWPMKTRLLAIATVLVFVAAVAGTSFAMTPLMSGQGHTCPMGMKHGNPKQPGCKHHRAPMPCCPMPTSNPSPSPSPAECMTRAECCQLSETRTRSLRNEGKLERANESEEKSVSKSQKEPSPTKRRTWVTAGLRYERPVFDLKTDLRI